MASQRFGKSRRLQRRAEFQRVFDTGQRVHGRFVTALTAPNETGTSRLGIVASKRLGDAVRRNRAKRLIREMFRQSSSVPAGQAIDIVVIPRRELFGASFSSLRNDFDAVLRRSISRVSSTRPR